MSKRKRRMTSQQNASKEVIQQEEKTEQTAENTEPVVEETTSSIEANQSEEEIYAGTPCINLNQILPYIMAGSMGGNYMPNPNPAMPNQAAQPVQPVNMTADQMYQYQQWFAAQQQAQAQAAAAAAAQNAVPQQQQQQNPAPKERVISTTGPISAEEQTLAASAALQVPTAEQMKEAKEKAERIDKQMSNLTPEEQALLMSLQAKAEGNKNINSNTIAEAKKMEEEKKESNTILGIELPELSMKNVAIGGLAAYGAYKAGSAAIDHFSSNSESTEFAGAASDFLSELL